MPEDVDDKPTIPMTQPGEETEAETEAEEADPTEFEWLLNVLTVNARVAKAWRQVLDHDAATNGSPLDDRTAERANWVIQRSARTHDKVLAAIEKVLAGDK